MNPKVLILFDEFMTKHDPGPGHPERPDRLRAIGDCLSQLKLNDVRIAKPTSADRSAIERAHDSNYVNEITSLKGRSVQLDTDTVLSPKSVEAAYLSAGGAIDAVNAVMSGEANRVFALGRPPGHHAESNRAMGFCFFNNIAIAAAHAIAIHGCQRVLIVDWDVHHGNGTQHIFESRSDVLFLSAHQWPWYPGTGALNEIGVANGKGFTVNAPVPGGMNDVDYVNLFRQLLVPIAEDYKPDLILVSAGFDAHHDDPLGAMNVTENGFATMSSLICELAGSLTDGRLVLILEGGYNLRALADSVHACIEVLAGVHPPHIDHSTGEHLSVIKKICEFHSNYWPTVHVG